MTVAGMAASAALSRRGLIGLGFAAAALGPAVASGSVLTLIVGVLVITIGSAVHGTALIRLALAIHAHHHTFGPCRGAGFLGMGVVLAGATAPAAGLIAVTAGAERATVTAAIGTIIAAPTYLLGLLLLPGAAPTLGARLRRTLDGVGIGVSLMFAAWLLAVTPTGRVSAIPLAVSLTCCVALSIAVIAGVRAVRQRRAALGCAAGASLSILGLTTLTVELGDGAQPAWLAAATLLMSAGPLFIVAGANRAGDPPGDPDPADADRSFAAYPVLAVPLMAAIGTAIFHFASGRTFDRTAMTLGAIAAIAVALREALAAIDVRRYAGRLAAQESRFRSLVTGSTDVIVILGADLVVRWQSPAAARQFGLSDQDVLGQSFTALLHPDDAAEAAAQLTGRVDRVVEARLRDGYGRWREIEATLSDQRADPDPRTLVIHVRDVGERAELRRELDQVTWYDELTGLANRRRLLATAEALRHDDGGALLVVELDRFAGVNNLHGGEVGDAVLVEAARRLRAGVGPADVVARLSADTFAVLTCASLVRAYALATRLLTVLAEPYHLPGRVVHLSADIGVADLSGGDDAEEVLRQADLARQHARQLGRGRAECYDASLEAVLVRRTAIEQYLPGVAERGELSLVYQPVVELPYSQPVGVEALVRWRHERLGLVSPADFLPVAEELGTVDEIVVWVLNQACRQLSVWRLDGRDLWMSVNVSSRQLASDRFLPAVAGALDTHCVPADRLIVEIGEIGPADPGMFDDPVVVDRLAGLRALGVRTSIDHFGTGPTALANLRGLPVDMLKIDRVLFTGPAGLAGPANPIIEVVVALARQLGVEVIAAGLETDSHVSVVRAAGCKYGQGFLLARPAHAEHVEAFLESHRTPLF